MKLSYVGVDLAKNVFQLHGVDRRGKAVWRRRLRRHQWLNGLLDRIEPGCVIGMEACTGAWITRYISPVQTSALGDNCRTI